MIRYYVKRSSHEAVQPLSHPPEGDVWVVGSQVNAPELHELAERYSFDRAVMRDVLDNHELPRIEYVADNLYIFLRTPQRTKYGEVTSSPLLVIANHTVFVTAAVSNFEPPLRVLESPNVAQVGDTGALLIGTLAATIDSYETLIKKTARYIRDTGHRLRSHEATNRDFIYFVTIEDNLNQFQMDLSGMLAVAQRLKESSRPQFSLDDQEALDDIILYIEQLLVSIASYTQSINSIRNAYSTVANNILNQRMKTLTILTVLIALPNVFYGMYGMNVALPFAENSWAFMGIVIFTVMLIFLVLLLAKRSRML